MSNTNPFADGTTSQDRQAAHLGTESDPLAEYNQRFQALTEAGESPIATFWNKRIQPQSYAESTLNHYENTYNKWSQWMEDKDRHRLCPNENHVRGFIEHLEEGGLAPSTIENHIWRLNKLYEFLQTESTYPHPHHYNPILIALDNYSFKPRPEKEPHRITPDDLVEMLENIGHYRDRLIVVLQSKLGVRAGALANMQLQDINLNRSDVNNHYDELGTDERVIDRPNSIVIPSCTERDRNKSKNDRVMPIDDELRRLLIDYLLVRPDNGEDRLVLSKETHGPMTRTDIAYVWGQALPDRFLEETQTKAKKKSHYGRYLFTQFWTVDNGLARYDPKMLYMRGDTQSGSSSRAINDYISVSFSDIEDLYREQIFKLGL